MLVDMFNFQDKTLLSGYSGGRPVGELSFSKLPVPLGKFQRWKHTLCVSVAIWQFNYLLISGEFAPLKYGINWILCDYHILSLTPLLMVWIVITWCIFLCKILLYETATN